MARTLKRLQPPKRKRIPGSLVSRNNPGKLRGYVLLRDDYTCRNCGNPYPEDNLECDHIIPLAEGGLDNASNAQCLCTPCHAEKTKSEKGQPWIS